MRTARRTALRWTLAAAAAPIVGACGFHLRGASQTALPFKSIYLGFADNSPLGTELRRYIQAGGTSVTRTPQEAEVILDVLSEAREKQILSLNSQGRVREYTLYYRFNFRLRDQAGKLWMAPTAIALKRDISFNEAQVLSKETEEAMLYRDMQSDLVQQILRRLAAAKPPAAAAE